MGKTLIFEYPRQTLDGEQKDGLIQYHRVYWGWRGFEVIQEDLYHH